MPVKGLYTDVFWCEHTQACVQEKVGQDVVKSTLVSDENPSLLVANGSVILREAPWPGRLGTSSSSLASMSCLHVGSQCLSHGDREG